MSEEIVRRAKRNASEGAVALEPHAARIAAMGERWDDARQVREKVMSPVWDALLVGVDSGVLEEYRKDVWDHAITSPGIPPKEDAPNVLVLPFDFLEQGPGPGGTATVNLASGHIDATVGTTGDADGIGGTLWSHAAIGVEFEAVKSGTIELRPMIVADWWWYLSSNNGLDCRTDGRLGASIIEPGHGTVAQASDVHLFSEHADSGFLDLEIRQSDGGGPIGGALNMRFTARAGHSYQFWLTAACSGVQSGTLDFAFSHAAAHVGARLILVVAEYV